MTAQLCGFAAPASLYLSVATAKRVGGSGDMRIRIPHTDRNDPPVRFAESFGPLTFILSPTGASLRESIARICCAISSVNSRVFLAVAPTVNSSASARYRASWLQVLIFSLPAPLGLSSLLDAGAAKMFSAILMTIE